MSRLKSLASQFFRSLESVALLGYYHRKVLRLQKGLEAVGRAPAGFDNKAREYYRSFGLPLRSTAWHHLYASVNGRWDTRYVSESIYYRLVEPKLNRYELAPAYQDKNAYLRYFPHTPQPATLLANRNGLYFSRGELLISRAEASVIAESISDAAITKPSIDSGGGRSVVSISQLRTQVPAGGRLLDWIEELYEDDFLIQERINQHSDLGEFHPSSLNTLRLMTANTNGAPEVVSSVARFGRGKSLVDNQAAGGLACGIDNGILRPTAVDKHGRTYSFHPDTGKLFAGAPITNYIDAVELVLELHRQLPYFGIVSWDVAITESGRPLLLELNLRNQEINFHQFCNGPLFGPLTETILRKAATNLLGLQS